MRNKKTTQGEHSLILLIAILLLAVILLGLLYMMREDDAGLTKISLQLGNIEIAGSGAVANGNIVTIKRSGHYLIEGTLQNGQIYIDVNDDETVLLELGGVDISNPTEAVIYVEKAERTTILLAAGTENTIQSVRRKMRQFMRRMLSC